MMKKILKQGVSATVLAVLLTTAVGSDAAEEGKAKKSYNPQGAKVGSFVLLPKFQIDETYDSNIFKATTGDQSDYITAYKPSVNLKSDWSSHSFSIDANGEVGQFLSSEDDDYEKYGFKANTRIDATKALTLNGSAGYKKGSEERGGDDVGTDAAAPVDNSNTTFNASMQYKPNRIGVKITGDYDKTDVDDNNTIAGATTNNDDRDRTDVKGEVRLGYDIKDEYEAFVKASYKNIDYNDPLDDAGANRDSTGYNIQGGLSINLSGLVTAELGAGWLNQEFDDATLTDVSGYATNANIKWEMTKITTLKLNADRAVSETTSGGISSTLDTTFKAVLDHAFLRNVKARLEATYKTSDYEGDPLGREDEKYTYAAGVRWKVNPYLWVNAKWTYDERDSNINTNDYDKHIGLAYLRIQY
jgi:hypothetical protein